ncbi:MAG TPA: hypothetical protein VLC72_01745 [Nitrosopumilaceae archaeon]|nr:hypothetical protein [Nitrosopumilaceae archaeon]
MKLFQKERPDMKCWNCQKLINHKDANWQRRKVGWQASTASATTVLTKLARDAEKAVGNKERIADPNQVFGVYEYEHRGQCPNCKADQCGFWFGEKSFNIIDGMTIAPEEKPFFCDKCNKAIDRELQIWYSVRIQQGNKTKENLVTLCPHCKTEQDYPFKYDLEYGIIE